MSELSSSVPDFFEGYDAFLHDLKARIQSAQVKAALSVNREMILLYLDLGQRIVKRQEQASWGSAVLNRLSHDLQTAFPGVAGFSRRNLYRMRALYLAYRDAPVFVPQLVAQILWGHNVVLLEKIKDPDQRSWYIQQTLENGWSRAILVHQIETDLYGRQVAAAKTTNFSLTLPPPQSDLAQQALKDPYVFFFLLLGTEAWERDLERGLLERIKDFLLELGHKARQAMQGLHTFEHVYDDFHHVKVLIDELAYYYEERDHYRGHDYEHGYHERTHYRRPYRARLGVSFRWRQ